MIPPITMKRPVLCRYSLAFSANRQTNKQSFRDKNVQQMRHEGNTDICKILFYLLKSGFPFKGRVHMFQYVETSSHQSEQ